MRGCAKLQEHKLQMFFAYNIMFYTSTWYTGLLPSAFVVMLSHREYNKPARFSSLLTDLPHTNNVSCDSLLHNQPQVTSKVT